MSDSAMTRLSGLPTEIRDADFALIARTTLDGVAKALADAGGPNEPGYVSITLPNGATVGTQIGLIEAAEAGPKAICEMLEALPAVSAYLSATEAPLTAECVSPIISTSNAGTGTSELCFPAGAMIRLSPGSGFRRDDSQGVDLQTDRPTVRITRSSDAPVATVSLWLGETVPLSIVIAPGTVVDLSAATDPVGVKLATGLRIVDDMMRLRDAGRITDVATILGGLTPDGMLRNLQRHPAASVLIGYGFLRTMEPEQMVEPFQDMAASLPNFADAAVLAGEAFARLGRHEEALDHLVRASEIGLPAFGFGMNYLIDRLRAYNPETGGPLTGSDVAKKVNEALVRVQVYAPAMLQGAVLTSYTLAE